MGSMPEVTRGWGGGGLLKKNFFLCLKERLYKNRLQSLSELCEAIK